LDDPLLRRQIAAVFLKNSLQACILYIGNDASEAKGMVPDAGDAVNFFNACLDMRYFFSVSPLQDAKKSNRGSYYV